VLVAVIKSEEARRRDLSSLLVIGIGGAPLGREVAERFAAVFPDIELVQVPCTLEYKALVRTASSILNLRF